MRSLSDFVDFHITVCGIDELQQHASAGVTHVLSILDPGTPAPSAFAAFDRHERLDLRFHDILDPAPLMQMAMPEDIERLLEFGRGLMAREAARLLVHCQMGISRSSAAMTLILAQARPDRPAEEALAEVARIRARAWPNLRVIELGDQALGRGGELISAARARYRQMIGTRPEIAQAMESLGRLREIRGA
ncbi:MAG TPA: protein-tyrosine-phosphatase [Stellaceae bacterium]|nr:protein-tyrosine-phosphatase [Stellaceae bacterium]